MQYQFFSIGCINDIDCAVNLTHYEPADMAKRSVKSYPFNFQECRSYPSGDLPNKNDFNSNGCLCTNHLTSPRIHRDINGNVYVTCTNVDGGSILFFISQAIIAVIHFYLALRCLFIFLSFAPKLYQNIKYEINHLFKPHPSGPRRVSGGVSLAKQHALFATLSLFAATACFGIAKFATMLSYAFTLPDFKSEVGKQYRISAQSLGVFQPLGYSFFELTSLHFTVLWMSVSPEVFAEKNHDKSSCFRALWYKRFIYFVELCVVIPIIVVLGDSANDISIYQVIVALVLIYEFGWGCYHISRLLRHIASNLVTPPTNGSSKAETDDESNVKRKVKDMADRIDKLSRQYRIFGALCISFYIPLIVTFDILRKYVSVSTITNPRAYVKEFGDGFYTAMNVVLFYFLHESLYGLKKTEGRVDTVPEKQKLEQPLQRPQDNDDFLKNKNNNNIGDANNNNQGNNLNKRNENGSSMDTSFYNLNGFDGAAVKIKYNKDDFGQTNITNINLGSSPAVHMGDTTEDKDAKHVNTTFTLS